MSASVFPPSHLQNVRFLHQWRGGRDRRRRRTGWWWWRRGCLTVLQPSSVPFIRHIGQLDTAVNQLPACGCSLNGISGLSGHCCCPCVSLFSPLRGWCGVISSGEAEADILPRSGGALTRRGHPRTRVKVKPVSQLCAFGQIHKHLRKVLRPIINWQNI